MRRRDGALATVAAALLWILLAAGVVGGVLELADLVSGSAPVEVADPAWSPLGAATGVARTVFFAALGAAAAVAVPAVRRRLRRGAAR